MLQNTNIAAATPHSSNIMVLCIRHLQTGTNKNPSSETSYWVKAFDDFGSASAVNSALTTHITNYGTLAALSNVTTARSNLSVYSIAQCDATFAPLLVIAVRHSL